MNKLLLVSYKSPPLSSPPSDRVYGFAKYLPASGWKPFLLTARNPFLWDQQFDYELYRPLASLHVSRAMDLQFELVYRGLRKLLLDPRMFFVFDESLGWVPHAYVVGKSLVERYGIDCIFASHPPPSSLLIGCMLSTRCDVPLVLDYRDPWNAYPLRSTLHRRFETSVENAILTRSDAIVTTSDSIRDELVDKYPVTRDKELAVVRNGFHSEMLEVEPYTFRDQSMHILHAGMIYGERIHHMLSFLNAVIMLRTEIDLRAKELQIILAGYVDPQITDHVRKFKLEPLVKVEAHMPHHELWSMMKSVDYLLCIAGWKYPLSSKIFEYAAAQKPIINIGDENGDTARLIAEYDLGVTVKPNPQEIARIMKNLLRFPLKIKTAIDINSFSRERETQKLATLLNHVIRRNTTQKCSL